MSWHLECRYRNIYFESDLSIDTSCFDIYIKVSANYIDPSSCLVVLKRLSERECLAQKLVNYS